MSFQSKRRKLNADSHDKPAMESPYMAAFQSFKQDLDQHHERRERIIKASRDITAASKKM